MSSDAPGQTAPPPEHEPMDAVVRALGLDPEKGEGRRVRDIVHTAAKLVRDGADTGEMKLISRSLKELRYALKVFRGYQHTRKVTIFGSARTKPDHPTYKAASDFAADLAGGGWMVITGAGDGIMRAGHGGAGTEKSFGVSIRLPFETNANDYIVGDPKLITFRYFFTRKLMFMWQSHAIAHFAGGFGTQDECFEALTLVQTGKAPLVPIVMVDAPGGTYWSRWDRYVREELLAHGLIGEPDLNLYHRFDDPTAAANHVRQFYRNYHSQRFVFDDLVLRMQRELTPAQVEALNDEFADLVATGRIEQGGPHEVETEVPDLPRLSFAFTKRDYGRLRALVDRVNTFDAENHPGLDLKTAHATPPEAEDFDEQTQSIGASA